MGERSHIEWTDATWNPITGCTVVSPGCTNCYAMKLAGTRLQHHPSRAGLTKASKAGPVWTGEVRFNEQWLTQPLKWKRPRMIFVCAHGDLFHESVPDEWIDRVFAVMALAPQHTFQVLTKRSKRMQEYLSSTGLMMRVTHAGARMMDDGDGAYSQLANTDWPLPNVLLGVSVEDQKRADERIPDLLATPAAVRWISAEPLLGPVDLSAYAEMAGCDTMMGISNPGLDWVIVGGESGHGARPMHPDWARSLRDQCAADGVAFYFKQWGHFQEHYDRDRDDPDWRRCGHVKRCDPNGQWLNLAGGQGFHGARVIRISPVGKKAAGRLLDDVEHNGFPVIGGDA